MKKPIDINKETKLNTIWLIENIIKKPMDKETKTWAHDPAVEKLHQLKEQEY